MTEPPQLTAVVVDYLTPTTTGRLVNELKRDPDVAEVVVVDNSGDPRYSLDHISGQGAVVVKASRRQGFGAGVNVGARFASSEYLLVLNSDLRLVSGRLRDLADDIEGDVALSAPLLIDPAGRPASNVGGRIPARWSFGWASRWRHSASPRWLTGAAFVVRRDLFTAMGGFDERYFMYWEDVDLCNTLAKMNYRVITNESVVMEHLSGGSDPSENSRYNFASRSRDQFLRKWNYPLVQRGLVYSLGLAKRYWLTFRVRRRATARRLNRRSTDSYGAGVS